MSAGFTGAIGFTALAFLVTLLGIRRPAAAGNAAAGEPGTTAEEHCEPCATLADHPGENRLSVMPAVRHYSRHGRRAEVP
jgi:hypothetical protein